ncbi:MAG: YihY/virulence factor BrkB family protein [Rikenellaceae bacterium]
MKTKIRRLINFISHDIWQQNANRGTLLNFIIGEIKVFIVTFSNYGRHQIAVRSAALTFYTIMSIVPIMAMVLGISKGFGIDSKVVAYLQNSFGHYQSIFDQISIFANSFLENSKVGIFAGISVIVLIWAVLMVSYNIEESFNHIWEIKKKSSISRRVSDYIAIVILLPILYTIYNSVIDYIDTGFVKILSSSDFMLFVYKTTLTFVSYTIVWMMFAVIYMLLPNTRVKFRAAFHAGVLAGTGYLIFKALYFYFQTSVSNYSVIYGSFAALPLFMLWLSICWQIVLFGAELSFAYQNLARYEYERAASSFSLNFRRKLMVLVVHTLTMNFINHLSPMSTEEIAKKLNLPLAAVRDIVYELLKASVVYSVDDLAVGKDSKTSFYTIGVDISNLTIGSLIDMVDNHGTQQIEEITDIEIINREFSNRDKLIKEL